MPFIGSHGAYVHGLSVNPSPRDIILPPLDRSSEETRVDIEQIPEDLRDLLSLRLLWGGLAQFRMYLPGLEHMDVSYWLRTSTGRLVPCRPVIWGVWRLVPPADVGGRMTSAD